VFCYHSLCAYTESAEVIGLVCIMTRLWTGCSGAQIQVGERDFFSSSKCPDWLRAHISFLGVKWPGNDIDHSPPSRARAKNEWNCTSPSSICLHCVERDNFTFKLLDLCDIRITLLHLF